jgi:DHA1 family inner membrane transport protein
LFALFGAIGFIGNVIATRIVGHIGAFATSVCFLSSLVVGITIFSLGGGSLQIMGTGFAFMGLGFAALNSMQQARLVAAGPHLASATVALNTSLLYVGQAIGSGIGGVLISHNLHARVGFVGVGFLLLALTLLLLSRPRPASV